MYKLYTSILILLVMILYSCSPNANLAGGIGQRHLPADNRIVGDSYIIKLQLFAHGGRADMAFSSIVLHFVDKNSADIAVRPQSAEISSNKESVICIFSIDQMANSIDAVKGLKYRFTYSASGKNYEFIPDGQPVFPLAGK